MNMPGDDAVDGIGNADKGLFDFSIRVSHGFKQGSMGCPFHSFFYQVAFHRLCLLKKKPLSASGLITVFVFFGFVGKLGHYQPCASQQISTSTTRTIIRLIRMLMAKLFFIMTCKLS
jgi:hypothetical protein